MRSLFEKHLFRTEKHLNYLPNITVTSILGTLIKRNGPVKRRSGLIMSTVLVQYILPVGTESFTKHSSRPEKQNDEDGQTNGSKRSVFKRRMEPEYSFISTRAECEVCIVHISPPKAISKVFPNKCRSSGGPTEPIARRDDYI